MSLTVTKKLPNGQPQANGYLFHQVADVLFDSSYTTGGLSLTAADLNFPQNFVIVHFAADAASGFVFRYDRSASKLLAFVPGIAFGAAGALTLDDFPLSGTGATATSIGLASTATSPVRFGPLQEVANTTNLSTVTTRVYAVAAIV